MSSPSLSPAHLALLTTLLDPDERVEATLDLASSHRFQIEGKEVDAAHVAVATGRRVLVIAAVDTEHTWHREWALEGAVARHESGLWRDVLVLGGTRWELPLGGGKAGRAFVEGLGKPTRDVTLARDEPPAPVVVAAPALPAMALPSLGELWRGSPPAGVLALWRSKLAEGEVVLALLETGTVAGQGDAGNVWFGVTTERAALSAQLTPDAKTTLWSELPAEGLRVATGLTRDTFLQGEVVLFEGPVFGREELRVAFGLASMPALRRLHEAAGVHLERRSLAGARALVEAAWRRAGLDAPAKVTDPLGVDLALRRARLATVEGKVEEALEALRTASQLGSGEALVEAARAEGLGGLGDLCALAAAHASVGHHGGAAGVYEALAAAWPEHELFLVEQARALVAAGRDEEALAVQARFIALRRTDEAFVLLAAQSAALDDPALAASDPELVSALLESGEVLERLGRASEGAARTERLSAAIHRYLDLIRAAPTLATGYERLFALHGEVREAMRAEDVFFVGQAATILRLLHPELAERLAAEGRLPAPRPGIEVPGRYRPLTAEDHDRLLVHPGEREATLSTWRWFAKLVRRERRTDDIEKHCERVEGHNHPVARTVLTHSSHLLGLPTPRCFLSHGASGAQVLGTEAPFLFLGAAHVDPGSDRHLPPAELCFALTSQLEHIRANHLVLTNSEFWSDFGSRALDGFVTLLSLVPLTATVGKALDALALEWVKRMQEAAQRRLTRTLVNLAHSRVTDGIGQGALQAGIDSLQRRLTSTQPVDRDTLVREQLASFARAALFTADRAGLLACDDLSAAVHAIFRLAPRASEELMGLDTFGLIHILGRKDQEGRLVYRELSLRLSELFKFALSDDYRLLRERYVQPRSTTPLPPP